MSVPSYYNDALDVPLSLTDEEYQFHEQATGLKIDSEDSSTSLKHHLISVQAEAYKVHPYPCVRRWNFARFKAKRNDLAYDRVLSEGKKSKSTIFVDAGCCMGTDVRSLVRDGFPADQILGTDLDERFIELGYKLYKDSPSSESSPAFLVGNLFSASFLDSESSSTSSPITDSLKSLTSLTPLLGKVRFIHCGSLFHLFSESAQDELACRLLRLLRPSPGSTIFGSHIGRSEPGLRDRESMQKSDRGLEQAWAHSPSSWKDLWEGVAQDRGLKVEVLTKLDERGENKAMPSIPGFPAVKVLVWSVQIVG